VIQNDSEDFDQDGAVFMLIEHIDTNRVYNATLIGRLPLTKNYPDDSEMTYACEFTTNLSNFTVHIDSPDDLDLYEVRLFKMATSDEHGHDINGMPTPLGTDLYGNVTDAYGGYNYSTWGVRAPNYASFPDYGVDANLKLMKDGGTSASTSSTTYFLVFIAEYSKNNETGVVQFYIKTDNTSPIPTLSSPLSQAFANEPLKISANVSTTKNLSNIWLDYSINGVNVKESIPMTLVDGKYVCYMPSFAVNDKVAYKISALDEIGNLGVYNSSFMVKGRTTTTCSVFNPSMTGGDVLEVKGTTTRGSSVVSLNFTCGSFEDIIPVKSDPTGNYHYTYAPKLAGSWTVCAQYFGDDVYEPSVSVPSTFEMKPEYTSISCSAVASSIKIGNDVELIGNTYPPKAGLPIEILLTSGSEVKTISLVSGVNGSFKLSEKLVEGQWDAVAQIKGNWRYSSASSKLLSVNVVPLSATELMLAEMAMLLEPPYIYMVVLVSSVAIALIIRWKSSVIAPKLPSSIRAFFERSNSTPKPQKSQSSGLRERYKRQSDEA
jgi:hypothetical protein